MKSTNKSICVIQRLQIHRKKFLQTIDVPEPQGQIQSKLFFFFSKSREPERPGKQLMYETVDLGVRVRKVQLTFVGPNTHC